MLSDLFTWNDGGGKPRIAVLAHNDAGAGPGGSQGGALRKFRYQMPDDSTRVADVTTYGNGGHGGSPSQARPRRSRVRPGRSIP